MTPNRPAEPREPARMPVTCVACGWKGRRVYPECECYDMPCRPWAPGAGCPGVWGPCPKCGYSVTRR